MHRPLDAGIEPDNETLHLTNHLLISYGQQPSALTTWVAEHFERCAKITAFTISQFLDDPRLQIISENPHSLEAKKQLETLITEVFQKTSAYIFADPMLTEGAATRAMYCIPTKVLAYTLLTKFNVNGELELKQWNFPHSVCSLFAKQWLRYKNKRIFLSSIGWPFLDTPNREIVFLTPENISELYGNAVHVILDAQKNTFLVFLMTLPI